MVNFKVGEMMTLYADVELKDFLGNKTLAKKGTKIWIGADSLAHYQNGSIQPLPENVTVKGYDVRGIMERIFSQLETDLPLDEITVRNMKLLKYIRESIEYALDELGLC